LLSPELITSSHFRFGIFGILLLAVLGCNPAAVAARTGGKTIKPERQNKL